jgi:hypothetical protein
MKKLITPFLVLAACASMWMFTRKNADQQITPSTTHRTTTSKEETMINKPGSASSAKPSRQPGPISSN